MMLRLFLPVLPGTAGDEPYAYLSALRRLSIPVRALPIGAAVAMGIEKRWYDISSSFTVPMSIPFVNVVCAPPGYQMGQRTPIKKSLASDDGVPAELRALLGPHSRKAKSSDGDVVYEPATAFAGLWTQGCKNIAIVYGRALDRQRPEDELEMINLARYDLVIRHLPPDIEPIENSDFIRYVQPVPDELARALGEACGFGISVTTAPSADTPEQPATTSPPSTASTTSSSRSHASRKAVIPPKRATSTSTSTPGRSGTTSTEPLFTRTWRFITRSLGFSKR